MNEPRPPVAPASPLVINAILFGCLAVGTAIVVFAAREIVNEHAIGDDGVVTRARVVDTRIMTSTKRSDSYEVQYAFEVGGVTYTKEDSSSRTNLWTEIEPDAWSRGRAEGYLDVEYSAANPHVNRAVHRANQGTFDAIAGMVVGLFCMAPAFLAAIAALRGPRASPPTST